LVSASTSGSEPGSDPQDPHSSFRLEVTVAIGYQRRRTTLGGAVEGHAVTLMLLLGGIVAVVAILLLIAKALALL
jgi:hypothetical protein